MAELFTKETFDFLRRLADNNDREWFNAHKSEYETFVREPALYFIRAMQPEFRRFAPHFVASDKKVGGSLMRIYRDVRFGKNKSPYKTNIGIQFRHEVGKDIHAPGLYLHIEPHEVFVGAGIWHPDGVILKKIRIYIDAHPTRWNDAIHDTQFCEYFHMAGDCLKRAPKGYPMDHPMIAELKRKDFIGIAPLFPELILQEDLTELVAGYFEVAQLLMQQLCRAVGVKY